MAKRVIPSYMAKLGMLKHIYTQLHVQNMHMHTHASTCTYTHIYISTHPLDHTITRHTSIYTYTQSHIHICIHIIKCIHAINMDTQTKIHT